MAFWEDANDYDTPKDFHSWSMPCKALDNSAAPGSSELVKNSIV